MRLLKAGFKPWLVKLFLLFMFLTNLGFTDYFFELAQESKVVKTEKQKQRDNEVLANFVAEKIASVGARTTRGEVYKASEYYADLGEIDRLRKRLGVNETNQVMVLTQIINDEMHNKLVNATEISSAASNYREGFMKDSQIKFLQQLKQEGWLGSFLWFFWLYLKTLPLALTLFLLWIREEQRFGGKTIWPHPKKFILLLIIYPWIVGKVAWQKMILAERLVRAEAELRRTKKNLFSYLTPKEEEEIKKFAKSALALADWRKELADLGFNPKYCLAMALAATFIVAFMPQKLSADRAIENFSPSTIMQQADQKLSSTNGPPDSGPQTFDQPILWGWQKSQEADRSWVVIKIMEACIRLKPICKQIDHVPIWLFGYQGIKPLTE
jgi:hypothetical protein